MVHFDILIYFSFYLCLITGLWNTFKLYILDVTGMCDICAFSCEVKEVDVSRMLLWFFVWFLSLFYFPTYISYNGNAFSLFFFRSLCFSGSFFIPFYSHKLLHGETLCRACKIDGFFVARYSGKWSEVNNVAISWKNENKTEGNRLVCPLLFLIWLDILFFFGKYQGFWA